MESDILKHANSAKAMTRNWASLFEKVNSRNTIYKTLFVLEGWEMTN